MLKTLWVARSQMSAFSPEQMLTTSLNSRSLGKPADQSRFFDELVSQIELSPGVRVAAASGCGAVPFRIVGVPALSVMKPVNLQMPCVSLHYREALGLRLISGRWLDSRDQKNAPPVAVLNQAAVKVYSTQFAGGVSPIGRQIETGGVPSEFPRIVGIVDDFKFKPDADDEAKAYVPTAQSQIRGLGTIFVRTSSDPLAFATTVRKMVVQKKGVSMTPPQTLEDQLSVAIAPRRFQAELLCIFAAIAFFLALIGIYGLLTFVVGQRVKEIGIRTALGATTFQVLAGVLRSGANLLLLGIGIGLIGSGVLTRLIRVLLYGVEAQDLATHALTCTAIFGFGMSAAYVPARRAVRGDPVAALRQG